MKIKLINKNKNLCYYPLNIFFIRELEKLNSKVEYVYYNNQKYDKEKSKKEIYCVMYTELVNKSNYFKLLKDRVKEGEKLLILGFDGFTFDPSIEDLKSVFAREDIIVGHEFVIMCLLLDKKPWEE